MGRNMEIKYPDYNNSIVNLVCSLLKYYNVKDIKHNTISQVDKILEERKPRNVVLMLFDAMGISILNRYKDQSPFIRSHIIRTLSSTFPPTTVAATTSVFTGLTPLETGWLGWITYFKEVDQNVVTFLNTIQNTKIPAAAHHLAHTTIPYHSILEQINAVHKDVICSTIAPYNVIENHPSFISKAVTHSCDTILNLCKKDQKNFIYCYCDNPDDKMHEVGVDAKECIAPIITLIDTNLKRLSESVDDDTVIFVIADHSQINSKWFFISDYPDLQSLIVRNHSMEFRAATFWVKEGKNEEFVQTFKKHFKDHFILMTHKEFLESGLLGSGVPHPRTDGFIGDFVAISTDEYCIDDVRKDKTLIGIHAGLTKEEMEVPLILL